jgi:hypothetical protein
MAFLSFDSERHANLYEVPYSLDHHDQTGNGYRMIRHNTGTTTNGVIALALLLGTACAAETQVAPTPTSPPTTRATTTTTTTSTTTTTTTTTLPPTVRTSDLPTVATPDGNPEDIQVLQRLLTATCCPRGDDGDWGPNTDESVQQLRTSLGLEPGGLDIALWEAVFTLDPPDNYNTIRSALHGVPLPHTAVQLNTGSDTEYHYVLAANTNGQQLTTWYRENHRKNNLSSWYWCRSATFGDSNASWVWWKRSSGANGPIVELTLANDGLGRFDMTVKETRGTLYSCDGYTPPATTPPATNPPASSSSGSSGSSSSGSSGSSGCTVGMNVERCEDRLGLGPGERFPYIDCSGSNRSIFWATNWWIIGVRNGTAIVSKSPYGCD